MKIEEFAFVNVLSLVTHAVNANLGSHLIVRLKIVCHSRSVNMMVEQSIAMAMALAIMRLQILVKVKRYANVILVSKMMA